MKMSMSWTTGGHGLYNEGESSFKGSFSFELIENSFSLVLYLVSQDEHTLNK